MTLTTATIEEQKMTLLSTGTDYEQLAATFRPILLVSRRGQRGANKTASCPMSRSAG
ncbi:acyl-CoA dehydrogenase family protein [Klebsiella michiganensis]|nr:acyl-CoA dehydrogenase family protein [Klebsiella michiganensis]